MLIIKKMVNYRWISRCFCSCFDKCVKMIRNKRIYIIILNFFSVDICIYLGVWIFIVLEEIVYNIYFGKYIFLIIRIDVKRIDVKFVILKFIY